MSVHPHLIKGLKSCSTNQMLNVVLCMCPGFEVALRIFGVLMSGGFHQRRRPLDFTNCVFQKMPEMVTNCQDLRILNEMFILISPMKCVPQILPEISHF